MSALMRRAAPGLALAGLAMSTVWLLDPALRAHDAADNAAQAPGQTESTTPQNGTRPDGSGPSTSAPETTDANPTDPGTASGGADSSGSGSSTSSDCSSPETVTGDAAMTRWGPVQVQVEFGADGRVCSAQAIAYPDNDPHSARINATAIPYLDQQASQVGVAFDSVSGATYTSEAYRESLQSALDQR